MNAVEDKAKSPEFHESTADEHRPRSERIAARGVELDKGKSKARYLIPLVGLAVLASMAFVSN
ncbi:hypothetical protein ASF61_11615 [Duganella sp. Leaf126]|uniref:hypothetical protein n=1 Tax=Duganella sp. Leaf126 TaxID=1736266 RepID=UPI0006F8832E|nr:hypothetical protein [Duganella sp. Leaf126]KQQ33694.1 hypothetical protein ASF61_11615 [Duganella sp. Leaf126]